MESLPSRSRAAASCIVLLAILAFVTACAPGTPSRSPSSRSPSSQEISFGELAILPTLEFANAPQVVLAAARDFRGLCQEAEVDRVLGRMDPETGVWLEFALVEDGVFYVLPALGYHTPFDRYNAERLDVPDADTYYALQSRDIPTHRFRSYFVE